MHGLLETPCYQRGSMSCLSCHRMHAADEQQRDLKAWADDQLAPGMEGDRACTQCHAPIAERVEAHTHHASESSGSRCYNCHMPHTSYGLLKAVRSHQVDNPRVQTELQSGRPNACNLCHLDRTLAWTAGALERWYGIDPPALSTEQAEVAAGAMWMLTGDAGVRALAAWSVGWEPAARASNAGSWAAGYLGHLLDDPYDAVRFIAVRSLERIAPGTPAGYDFLADPAARKLARDRVVSAWLARPDARDGAGGAMLGAAMFDRLAMRRDDRHVELHE
jgi:hypothetical protein